MGHPPLLVASEKSGMEAFVFRNEGGVSVFRRSGLFSLGLVGPIFLFFVGFISIALSCSAAAIVARVRSGDEPTAQARQRMIDLATAILAGAPLLMIFTFFTTRSLAYYFPNLPVVFIWVWCLLLWPISAIVTFFGNGTGKRQLLKAHVLIALWTITILLVVWIHDILTGEHLL
jgi:hypothetical protein